LVIEMKRSFMNKKWVLASSFVAFALVHASGQTSGGGGGTSGGGTSGGATTSSGSSGQSSTTVNSQTGVQNPQNPQVPGVQNPNQLPPGLQNRQQLPPGTPMRGQVRPGAVTNQFTGGFTNQNSFTNEFAGRTNQFGTNLPPTGRGTNHFSSTNGFDFRHFDRNRFRDEAITPSDQTLLIRIKQTIITEISVSVSGGTHWMPIHCSVNSGQVRLMGLVRSMDEAQRLLAMVSQMPGVSGVENGLNTLPADQAASESDRVILTQIRQVIPLSQPSAPWTPVSFDVRQGAVGIVGIVPTTQESQRIETTVRQVPGVVRTSNTLIVDASVNTGATPTSTVPR
jgi:osmotically-inducible protein OsmY